LHPKIAFNAKPILQYCFFLRILQHLYINSKTMIFSIKKARLLLLLLAFITLNPLLAAKQTDYSSQVNTLIGTEGNGWSSGYLFPGATYPLGMVQFTPTYFTKHLGFVINQLSGAGCDHMGNFPTFPLPGKLSVSPDSIVNMRVHISDEKGVAGYYKAVVNETVGAELTVTERTGMARFTFSGDEKVGTVIIGGGISATPMKVAALVITGENSFEGYAEGGSFCGFPTPYKVYIAGEFDVKSAGHGIWKNESLKAGATFAEGKNSGIYFSFDVTNVKEVSYKMGISYVSVANAKENLVAENPNWNFNETKDNTVAKWNKCLGKIEVEGGSADRKSLFYTHLYRSLAHPNVFSDVNGQYIGSDGKVYTDTRKHYTSFSNWDTYRSQTQLLAMFFPEETSDIVNSHMLFALRSGGGLPRWVLANIETGIMQGDPSSVLISNAFAFGARNYDARSVLDVMRKGAEVPNTRSQTVFTRPGLKQYLEKGYYDASMMLEYTSADFAIAQFALNACNNEPIYGWYKSRSANWKNIYNPKTNWLQSRNADGSWKGQGDDWREATYKNYFWMVPYNLGGLIDTIGGKKVAEDRLDNLFRRLDASYGDDWYASGNEPNFQVAWAYNWAGAPYKTQSIIRRILNEQFTSKIDGLPGNDDLGAMGSWYVLSSIGLFPVIPGVGGFSINSPLFEKITLNLPKGKVVISGGEEKNPFIQSMKVNGKTYNNTWLNWDEIQNGGTIEYKLSDKPNTQWGTSVEAPSFK